MSWWREGIATEWNKANTYSSFNSFKGLTYFDNYKKIMAWMRRETDYLPPPVEVNLDPFAECNNRCYFCVGQRYLRANRVEVGEMRSLPLDYMMRLVDFLAGWGVRGLCISGGGEPSLHPEIDQVIVRARARGMDVAFVTNMVRQDEWLAEALLACRWVAMSVNAPDATVYKRVMGTDHFHEVIDNIEHLAKLRQERHSKVDLCFKYLLLPENVHGIFDACNLAKSLGVQDFHVRPVDFEREDIKGHKALRFDKALIEEQFEKCHEIETPEFRVFSVTHKFDSEFHVKHDFDRCLATPLVLPILTDGAAYICVDKKMESDFKLGDAFPNPEQILDWWGSEEHRSKIESVDVNRCSRCTWSSYQKQIEAIEGDTMCLAFP